MKKNIMFFTCCILVLIMVMGVLAGCAKSYNDPSVVNFWVYGSTEQLAMYNKLVKSFNDTYAKDKGFSVKITTKPNGTYSSSILYTANSNSGPDVILVQDAEFKQYAVMSFFCNIQNELDAVTDIDISDLMPSVVDRFRYNITTNTSNSTDPLYALPLECQPTALYYNEDVLQQAGIIIISVDEADMDDWNAGKIADKRGNYKKDFEKLADITVPKKGFFRSENPYVSAVDNTWTKISKEEILVFNNRIAMNWDEVEDVASIFSVSTNADPNKKSVTAYNTTYGYFTENWFNYGWSVGGDCLMDLTGEGDWNFSLLDSSTNYVVMKGTFIGRTGTVYNVGETVEFVDRMDIKAVNGKDEILVANNDGSYSHSSEIGGGAVSEWSGVAPAVADGTLVAIPSTASAFARYLKLGASTSSYIEDGYGLNIAPNPNTFSNRTAINYFYGGNIAFVMSTSPYMTEVSKYAKFKYDVCPLVVYKEYTDPTDPYCDTVKAQGKQTAHSNTISMGIRSRSQNKERAAMFIKWCASSAAQQIRAEMGFFPNQKSLLDSIKFDANAPQNASIFAESLSCARPGDWWYMPDYNWVQRWCIDLNAEVRNGTKDYAVWKPAAIDATNAALKEYKQYQRT